MTTPAQSESPEPSLQFDTARPATGDQATVQGFSCSHCHQAISDRYFELRGQTFCATCADQIGQHLGSKGTGQFGRAALYGVGAAIAGAVLYYAIRAATGLEIGLIAIAVGWMVGRAVQKGGAGFGGRKYQVLAVLLTYLAIGATYVPLAFQESHKSDATASTVRPDSVAALAAAAGTTSPTGTTERKPLGLGGWITGMGALIFLALILPILGNVMDLPAGFLGLIIVYFGLMQAWRMNRRVEVQLNGPFQVANRQPQPATPAT